MELKIFENEEFGKIRTAVIDDEPYFVGKDVSTVFGDKNHNRTLARVDDEDKTIIEIIDSMGRKQNVIAINESGLYSMLFAMQPQKANHDGVPNAYPIETQERIDKLHKFKRWVTSDVLPSIRKHGAYLTSERINELLRDPDTIIQLCNQLKSEQLKNQRLKADNSQLTVDKQIMQPKADYFDELVDRNLLTGIRETAKELGIKQNVFTAFLLKHKYLYRDKKGRLMPYADKNDGLFELKECYNEKTKWTGTQTMVTPKGKETFRLLII